MKEWAINALVGATIVSGVVATFVGIDYLASKDSNPSTFRVRGTVVAEAPVYKRLSIGGGYAMQGDGFAGKIGAFARKVTNVGNAHTGYAVHPEELSWMTQGGIFFKPVRESLPNNITGVHDSDLIAVVSSADIADVGEHLSFQPKDGRRFLATVLGRTPADLTLKVENGDEVLLHDPLVDPYDLKKVE